MSMDPAVAVTLRLAGALLFAAAALHKLRDVRAFREALAGYRLLPAAALGPAALALPAAEAATALALCSGSGATAGAAGGVALLALYAGAIAVNLGRGRRSIDCGCGGPGGRRPIAPGLVWRNAALAALLAASALPAAPRAWTWLDGVTVAGGVVTLALLYAALDVLLANRARFAAERSRARERLERLELEWATR